MTTTNGTNTLRQVISEAENLDPDTIFAEELQALAAKLSDAASAIEEEVNDLKEKTGALKEEISELTSAMQEMENETIKIPESPNTNKEHLIRGLAAGTLHDDMKVEILANMFRNLSLQQIEEIEEEAKAKLSGPYVII